MPIPWPDVGSTTDMCTVASGTCAPGHKCLPVEDPNSNERRCTPIIEDPAGPGEPCYVGETPEEGDSCGQYSICWNVDDTTRIGYCVAFCGWCGPQDECIDQGSFGVCLDVCHPLLQDCPLGHGCYPDAGLFICAPDLSGELGAAGDPCNAVHGCDRGNACVVPNLTPGCEGDYCCSALCEVGDSSDCLEGQQCLALPFDDASVGVCGAA